MNKRILATLLFASVARFAQTTSTGTHTPAELAAHQVTHLTKLLALSSTQQSQATAIFTTAETAVLPLVPTLKTARATLKTAVEANDSATIATQTTEIGALTSQELLARATGEAAFYAILTPTQQTQYAEVMGHDRGAAHAHRH